MEHVASVNVEKEYDIIIWYDDRYEVKLGGTEQLDYKADYLLAILDSLSEYQAGTIDLTLSTDNKATFEAKT